MFRLRHLNTGRLVVMQNIFPDNPEFEGKPLKTVGLSEHYPTDTAKIAKDEKSGK